jgi:exopolysaccharide biosynthesis polyprenyl glycosylphosphotransferase
VDVVHADRRRTGTEGVPCRGTRRETPLLYAPGAQEAPTTPTSLRGARRFVRRRPRPGPEVRLPGAVITEGRASEKTLVREGTYRRALLGADVLVSALVPLAVSLAAGLGAQPILLLAVPVTVLVNKVMGLYDRDDLVLHKSTLDEVPALFQVATLFALLVWLLDAQFAAAAFQPAQVVLLWGGMVASAGLARAAARRFARSMAAVERCLMIGTPDAVAAFRRKLGSSSVKAELVASMELTPGYAHPELDEYAGLVRRYDVHRVVVAPLTLDASETLEIVRLAKRMGLRVSVIPRLFDVVGSSVVFDELDGLTILGIRRFGLARSSRMFKRAFDVAGAALALVALAPLMAILALAIRMDTAGPILFRQERVGRDGRRFRIFKFRSMVDDAERLKPGLIHLNETRGLFKIAADPRVTRVGRWMRRSCVDELPQLFNVLRGEMSLVGPRPLIVDEDVQIIGPGRSRLMLTPGITGPWQVLKAGRIPMDEMVAIDDLYVANWTLWNDLKILLRTFRVVMARGNV